MGFAAMLVCLPVSAAINIAQNFCVKPRNYVCISPKLSSSLPDSSKTGKRDISFNVSSYPSSYVTSRARTRTTSVKPAVVSTARDRHHWMVVLEKPIGVDCKEDVINYYVKTLETVLGSESEARKRIYDVSCESHFGFCCDMEENASLELARLPGVLSVRPDPDPNCSSKDYSLPIVHSGIGSAFLFPTGSSKHWLVRMNKPGVEVVTKAQMVDFCVHILKKVLGNERDAQMCIYHISWQSNFGFCCELDKECAQELAGVPGVISVQPDENFESSNKDYGGYNPLSSTEVFYSSGANQSSNMRTKKLFVTGLSFYTSEKTLRAAFEGFGELVEVRIIMDKISKRSKGYGFVEYTTEEAASAALKEMNGKIINGWMIIVDVAKSNPPKYIRGQPRPQQLPV